MFGKPPALESIPMEEKSMCKYPGCPNKWSVALGQHGQDSQGYCSRHAWNKPENAKWLIDRERNRGNMAKVKELMRWIPRRAEVEVME